MVDVFDERLKLVVGSIGVDDVHELVAVLLGAAQIVLLSVGIQSLDQHINLDGVHVVEEVDVGEVGKIKEVLEFLAGRWLLSKFLLLIIELWRIHCCGRLVHVRSVNGDTGLAFLTLNVRVGVAAHRLVLRA